jgi:hypothetical protein
MTHDEIHDETMRYTPQAPPPPPPPPMPAARSQHDRSSRIAIRVAVAVLVGFATFGFNGGWFSGSSQSSPKIDVSAIERDLASGRPGTLPVTGSIPTRGCLNHFLSDPKVKVVPCDEPHLSELIGTANVLAPAGHQCADAREAVLGPDVVELRGASLMSDGQVQWGPDEATCSLRYDVPMTGTAQALAPLIVVKGTWALDPGTCLTTGETDARPVDCSQSHQAEVVSGPVLRPDGADIGDLCIPPLRVYLRGGRAASDDQVEFVWRKDTPNVGRCLVVFATPRTGLQRG